MSAMHEELARLHGETRRAETRKQSTGYHLARAQRLSRRAERAARQARLALARAL